MNTKLMLGATAAVGLLVLAFFAQAIYRGGGPTVKTDRQGVEPPLDQRRAAAAIAQHCAICHTAPTPQDLPTPGWRALMADKLQIMQRYAAQRGLPTSALPDQATLAQIADYLMQASPSQEQLLPLPAPLPHDQLFVAAVTRYAQQVPAAYTDIEWDAGRRQFWASDFFAGQVVAFSESLAPLTQVAVGPFPLLLEPDGAHYWLALMGNWPADPGDLSDGQIVLVERRGELAAPRVVQKSLRRPVRALPATLFGQAGLIVDEFGWFAGASRFWPKNADGTLGPATTLIDSWGVVGAMPVDFDGDSLPELVALVSQEKERLTVHAIGSDGLGAEREVFSGGPGYGFNGLIIDDINDDGRPDILVSNGDNYDIDSGPLKPYHGVRIFINNGDHFAAPIFLYCQGAIKILAADFDNDGRRDILAISVFPDWRQRPYQSALLFRQTQPLVFEAQSIKAAEGGRWLSAAAADFDNDGDIDVALGGGYSMGNEADRQWTQLADARRPNLLLLRNQAIP